MKYVPSLPPVSGVERQEGTLALTRTKRVKPVRPRTLPPQLNQPVQNNAIAPVERGERREEFIQERRKYCRRVVHQTMLEELRSGLERRRHQQREGDAAEHIDEQV